jgi:hypothetical protein
MPHHRSLFAASLAAAMALSLAVPAWAASEHFHADMTGGAETPPTGSAATGTADATLDTATKTLDYTVSWSGLTGPAIMAHFHGPAPAGKSAGVLVKLGMSMKTGLNSPLHGTAKLTDAQIKSLEAGLWYVNVHTPAHKGGEIRGQMEKAP